MVTLDDLQRHLRMDDGVEEDYLVYLLEATAEYISSITGIQNDQEAPKRFDHAVLLLAGHWHQNREAVSEGNLQEIPYGLKMLLTTLRNIGPGIHEGTV